MRHPELAAEIRAVCPALAMMEKFASSTPNRLSLQHFHREAGALIL